MRAEIVEAKAAFDRGEHEEARRLILAVAQVGDVDAQALLGAWCMTDWALFDEAEKWLRSAADKGCGIAAHNLGVLYSRGWPGRVPDPECARVYLQRAVDSGFEASVASDPLWWKR